MSQELDIPDSRWDTGGGQALADSVAALANLLPGVGGVVSAVASGRLVDRKLQRVAQTVDCLRVELGELRAGIDEDYVASEDFEELLEEALLQAAREKSETKRKAYASFVAHDLQNPSAQSFDVKLRILRKLEELQDEHLRLLAAIVTEVPPRPGDEASFVGSRIGTLARRMRSDENYVGGLFEGLQHEDLVDRNASVRVTVTPAGAEQTKQLLTRLGQQLVEYLSVA